MVKKFCCIAFDKCQSNEVDEMEKMWSESLNELEMFDQKRFGKFKNQLKDIIKSAQSVLICYFLKKINVQ